jgi:hypothetical protein
MTFSPFGDVLRQRVRALGVERPAAVAGALQEAAQMLIKLGVEPRFATVTAVRGGTLVITATEPTAAHLLRQHQQTLITELANHHITAVQIVLS